jgi:hypothetical protein
MPNSIFYKYQRWTLDGPLTVQNTKYGKLQISKLGSGFRKEVKAEKTTARGHLSQYKP